MRLAVIAAVSCSIVGLAVAADAKASIKMPVDIPAESLDLALKTLAKDRGFQMVFRTEVVGSARTRGAHGQLTTSEALSKLLEGTHLTYAYLDDNTVTIAPADLKKIAVTSPDGGGSSGDATSTNPSGGQKSSSTLLAQVGQTSAGPSPLEPSDKEVEKKPDQLEEVVVTGTHIAGAAPVGSSLITVTQSDITNSGYSNIGDVIRSLPQAFGGGINPGVLGTTQVNGAQNVDSASTVNLRGLGSDSTLTLIDGHRLAANGFTSAVDISSIPLSALDRVEILTDSASAIYGSDAVAGVANFILRKDYEGAQTSASVGEANGGAAKDYTVGQLLGTNWSGGNVMLSYEHFRQDALYASDRSFSSDTLAPLSLLPEQKKDSALLTVHQDFTDSLSAYAEALYSHRDYDTVFSSAYGTGQYSAYSGGATTQYAISTGFTARLVADWTAGLDGTASRDKDDGFTYYIPAVTTRSTNYYDNRADSIELHGAGTAFVLPSGPVEAAIGGGHRTEGYNSTCCNVVTRNINYGYAEFRVPLVGDDVNRIGLEKLQLSAAARYENYSDFGAQTNPKLGLLYQPIEALSFRSSWGKSFRAPDLDSEYSGMQVYVFPGAAVGASTPPGAQALYVQGSNVALRPETANSWSSGFDFKPAWAPQIRLSATYFNTDYDGRITQPVNSIAGAVTNPIYAAFVTPNPSAAAQATLISQAAYFTDFTGDYDPAKVVAILNNQYQNVVSESIHGVDVTGDYRWQATAIGNFDLSLNTAWLRITEILTPGSPELALTGTIFNPPRFKARLGLTWQRGPWSAASFVNYVSSEIDNAGIATVPVASWTTLDAQVAFDASGWGGFFHGARISLSGQNLLNRDPPSVPGASTSIVALGYDSTNASPLGRFASLTLRKDW